MPYYFTHSRRENNWIHASLLGISTMQASSSRIWTRVSEFISYDNNYYNTGTRVCVCVCVCDFFKFYFVCFLKFRALNSFHPFDAWNSKLTIGDPSHKQYIPTVQSGKGWGTHKLNKRSSSCMTNHLTLSWRSWVVYSIGST